MPKFVQAAYVKFVDSIHNNIRTGNAFKLLAREQYSMENATLSFRGNKEELVSALQKNDIAKAEEALKDLYLQVDLVGQNNVRDLSQNAFEILLTGAIKFVAVATESVFENLKATEVKETITQSLLGTIIDYSTTTRDIMLHLFSNFKKMNAGEEDLYTGLCNQKEPAKFLKQVYTASVEFEACRFAPPERTSTVTLTGAGGVAVGVQSNIFGNPDVMEIEMATAGYVAADRGPTTPFKTKGVDEYAYSFESANYRVLGYVNPYAEDVVEEVKSQVPNFKGAEAEYIKQMGDVFKKWQNDESTNPTFYRVYDNGIQHSTYFGATVISMIVSSSLTVEEKILLLWHTCNYDYSTFEYDAVTLPVLKQCVALAGCKVENSFPVYREALKKRAREITNDQIRDCIRNNFDWAFFANIGGKLC